MEREPTIKDVMGTLNGLAEAVREGFRGIDARFDGVEIRLDRVKNRLTKVEPALDRVEGDMVTKGFLECRFEKSDAKIGMLVHILAKKRLLNESDRSAIRLA